jgi:hypothetical protein
MMEKGVVKTSGPPAVPPAFWKKRFAGLGSNEIPTV